MCSSREQSLCAGMWGTRPLDPLLGQNYYYGCRRRRQGRVDLSVFVNHISYSIIGKHIKCPKLLYQVKITKWIGKNVI